MKCGIFIILIIITILLLSGKGGFLIAGYNTASKKEKAAYDFKRLSLVMGIGMGALTLLYLLFILLGNRIPFFSSIFAVITVAITIIMLILCNTICRTKDPLYEQESMAEVKRQKSITRITIILTTVILIVVCVLLFSGDVKVLFQKNYVTMDVPVCRDGEVYYKDIKSITLRNELVIGSRTNGIGTPRLQAGNYRNEEFGNYLLYSYTGCNRYIVVKTETATVVFNGKNDKETQKLFQQLKEKL